MTKLILTSFGIISIALLFLIFTKKENYLNEKNINSYSITSKDNNLEINKQDSKSETLFNSNIITNPPKNIIVKNETSEKKVAQESPYLAYLSYRKNQHNVEEQKRNHYLNHQKELKHIREGGVKSELQKEKRKHEVQFQHQYKSTIMSQTREQQKNFMEQKRKIERRREQMHSLKDKQQLQTKYRGEL